MAATKNKRKTATSAKATKAKKTKKETTEDDKTANRVAICNLEYKNILPEGSKRSRTKVNYKESVTITVQKKVTRETKKPEKITKPKRVRTKAKDK